MKPNRSLMRTLLIVVLVGVTIPLWAESVQPAGTKTPVAGKAAPAKDAEQPKIPGIVIAREKGGFLGLVIENSNFKLSFYDEKRKPVPSDVARATARWAGHHSIYDERAVLNLSPDRMALTSSKFVQPPYTFKLYLALIAEDDNAAVESHTVDVHQ